jgi:hypothetical protein
MNAASKKSRKYTPSKKTYSRSRSRSKSYSIRTERDIVIPRWAKIVNYRTMNNEKKDLAVAGHDKFQIEWMLEEVNEFYEAVQLQDIDEIRDEAIGLIRTYQQFRDSKTVVALWKKVRNDVLIVFRSRKIFMDTFAKWHAKKLKKNQARDVVPEDLIDIAGLKW